MKRLWLIVPLLVCGCHGMDRPEHFVDAPQSTWGQYHVRAVSAEGVVVGLRTEDNPARGTLEFWTDALRRELASRGYQPVPVRSEEIRSKTGRPGRLLEFSTMQQGVPFTYLLAVYVTDGTVLLAEAGGKSDDLAKRRDDLRVSLLSAR